MSHPKDEFTRLRRISQIPEVPFDYNLPNFKMMKKVIKDKQYDYLRLDQSQRKKMLMNIIKRIFMLQTQISSIILL